MDTTSDKNNTGVYFANLDALRFFAASAVLFSHIESRKPEYSLPNSFLRQTYINIGSFSVTLFFVLSGFLITYLLLLEKETSKSINIKNFYARRILRIWPLYYLLVLTGLLVVPYVPLFDMPRLHAVPN